MMNTNKPPQLQLGLLRQWDRTMGLKESIAKHVKSGDVVLDAGCGTGVLSLLALQAGASKVVAIDNNDLSLAKAIAHENNWSHAIEFIQTDLREFDLSSTTANQFDVILAMLYSGHPRFDRHQMTLKHAMVEKYLAPHGTIIPHQIRWFAYACDWARHDFSQYCSEASRYIHDLERQWGLKFQTFRHYFETEADDLGVMVHDADVYEKAVSFQYRSYDRLERSNARMLSQPTLVADVHYEKGKTWFPENITFDITEPGRMTTIIWVRELLHDGLLISSRETASLVRQPLWLNQGEQCIAMLDDIWQQTNVVSVTKSSKDLEQNNFPVCHPDNRRDLY
jgi:SAM-dependent methyltransferase